MFDKPEKKFFFFFTCNDDSNATSFELLNKINSNPFSSNGRGTNEFKEKMNKLRRKKNK